MVNRIGTVYPYGSNRDSVWTLEFNMEHLKKVEEHIDLNVVILTIKVESIVRIF